MTIEELMEKRAELDAKIESFSSELEAREDLDEAEKELNALVEERNQLNSQMKEAEKAAERKKELRNAIAGGRLGQEKRTFGEEKKMEKRFEVNSVEYREAYLKHLMGKEITEEERAAINAAKAVIPTETINQIYGKLSENQLFAELNVTHFPNYASIPVASAVNDASWVDMAAASTDSDDTITSIALNAYKLIKTVEVNADVKEMSIPAFEAWLVDTLSKKMIKAVDAAVIGGAGATQPTGVLTSVTATGAEVSYDGLLAAMANVDGAYHDGAIWVMSANTFFNNVMALKDANKRPLVYQGMAGIEGAPVYTLLGHKVILEDSANKSVIFGNFKEGYVFNFAKEPEITSDASAEFRKASTVYRAYALADGKVADVKAFGVITVA